MLTLLACTIRQLCIFLLILLACKIRLTFVFVLVFNTSLYNKVNVEMSFDLGCLYI